ncbi:MAG: sulfatase-like hydrolase/transferase [Planctomycetota bacterium]|nr:sulfatase-like hydrolase/transferase [Planctomycetota bacterium]
MPAAAPRPNFILLFPDQWRGDALSGLGHPVAETPWLDALMRAGVTFPHAYSPAPSCIPARACLATGLTPSSTGRLGQEEGVPWRYERTYMRLLRDGGYQTMLAGKTHFYPQMTALGYEKLLQYEAKVLGDAPECDYHAWLERAGGGHVRDTGMELNRNTWYPCPWPHPEHLHPNSWTMDAALELLKRRDPQRPFLLHVGFNRPHPPFDPPVAWFQRYQGREMPAPPVGEWVDRDASSAHLPAPSPAQLADAQRAYYAQLAHLDYQVGRLIHYLKSAGSLWRDTFILFASDHGEMLGDHNRFGKVVPMEGSARVPFVLKPAGGAKFEAGGRCEAPVTLSDVMPTLLEEAGLPVPGEVEGRSLSAALRGSGMPNREYVHGEMSLGAQGWQFVTDGREKFCWESVSGREWFFDLREDPRECRNLAAAPAARPRVERWRGRLIEILARRPQDGLSDGARLLAGKAPPRTRPELKGA